VGTSMKPGGQVRILDDLDAEDSAPKLGSHGVRQRSQNASSALFR